jgi:hypothetical protein
VFQHAERPVTERVSRGKPIVRSTAKRVYVAAVIASIALAGVSAVVFSQHEKTAKPLADPGRVPSELVKIRNGFVIASWHAQNGTPMHVLQELGGWESPLMVRRYAHFATEHLAAYANNAGIVGTNWSQPGS